MTTLTGDSALNVADATRIRRSVDERDHVIGKEAPRTYPIIKEVTCGDTKLSMQVHRSRWAWLDDGKCVVKRKQVTAKLYHEGKHIGSFRLNEYDVSCEAEASQVFEFFDYRSAALSELGGVLCGHWPELFEVTDYGTIAELERAWMAPAAASGRHFSAATQALVSLSRRKALLLLKAFPLEYEGRVDCQNTGAHARRQRALMRMYSAILGVQPVPGRAGERGWMFRVTPRLADYVPDPLPEAAPPSDWL